MTSLEFGEQSQFCPDVRSTVPDLSAHLHEDGSILELTLGAKWSPYAHIESVGGVISFRQVLNAEVVTISFPASYAAFCREFFERLCSKQPGDDYDEASHTRTIFDACEYPLQFINNLTTEQFERFLQLHRLPYSGELNLVGLRKFALSCLESALQRLHSAAFGHMCKVGGVRHHRKYIRGNLLKHDKLAAALWYKRKYDQLRRSCPKKQAHDRFLNWLEVSEPEKKHGGFMTSRFDKLLLSEPSPEGS